MKSLNVFLIGFVLCFISCNSSKKNITPVIFAPKDVEAHGYVVPKDSMAEPRVIHIDEKKLKKIIAKTPKVVFTNSNVYPAGTPKVVLAGVPRVCTPGQGIYSLPKSIPAIHHSIKAGIPEIVIAQTAYAKDHNPHNFSSFSKLQGLKSSGITCLAEDGSGNLWIGHPGAGISKYDGKSFTSFTDRQGLSDNYVISTLVDRRGNIWIGTLNGGVCKYDGKSFTCFTVKEGLSSNIIGSILEDRKGNLWFGTGGGGGVSRYDGKNFIHFTEKEGLTNLAISGMVEDQSGDIWFGTHEGGIKYDGIFFIHFRENEGLINNSVLSILKDQKGNIWFGTGEGVCKYEPPKDGHAASFTHYTEREGLSNKEVWSMLEDENRNIWFGTKEGVFKYDGQRFTHFTDQEGLSANDIKSIIKDRSGNLWLGTSDGGLNKYSGAGFTHFSIQEGLSDNVVNTILEDKNNNLWFGTWEGGVSKYNGTSFTHITNKEGLHGIAVRCLLEDQFGNFWLADYSGVSKFDGKSFISYKKEGLSNDDIFSMLQDRKGNIWFGTHQGGVNKYQPPGNGQGASFTHFTEREGLSNNFVIDIEEDKNGNLWFGTYGGGLNKYEPAKDGQSARFTHFKEQHGLSDNYVKSILEDKEGNLWIGTLNGGVNKYESAKDGQPARFIQFTTKQGLANNDVRSIMEDKSGNLWFGTLEGLSKFDKGKLASYSATYEFDRTSTSPPTRQTNNVTHIPDDPGHLIKSYTYDDGFVGIEVNHGKTILEDKNGTLWIGAGDRLTVFQPGQEVSDTTMANIQITGLSLFNENIDWQNYLTSINGGLNNPRKVNDTSFILGNGVKVHDFHFDSVSRWYGVPGNPILAYDNNYLTFQFVGITLKSPKKVKYQYKLEGLDQDWSALTTRSEATYGNISHGKYTFKVKAMNGEGYWSNELSYSFVIRPPWWFTWWAYIIYGLLIGVSGWWVYRYQKQRIVRLEREKAQARELEQAKEIEKAYNQLGQAHENLKATQTQLIHAGKMASLGELTAGIAHEIQNPLNFVNNFSEINKELIADLNVERSKLIGDRNNELEAQIIKEIEQNEEKIIQHGKRADIIVKGMLQHSRSNSDKKELTDINALCGDYIRLAYHGLQAKDASFRAKYETHFDPDLPRIHVIPQELGRALLNIINNAFQACAERTRQGVSSNTPPVFEDYQPTVVLTTLKEKNKILIKISDNGPGISESIKDKIFHPFFTTKPTGQGTGLGLSLAYDIITKGHNGTLTARSPLIESSRAVGMEGKGTEFVIQLPIHNAI